jgi:hypothetical protein
MVNEELRTEVDNLRREMERLREERLLVASGGTSAIGASSVMHEEAPPSYFQASTPVQ